MIPHSHIAQFWGGGHSHITYANLCKHYTPGGGSPIDATPVT